jgi:hypothetical protein
MEAFYFIRAQLRTAQQLAEQCLGLAQQQTQPGPLVQAHWTLGQALFHRGRFTEAQAQVERGIALYAIAYRILRAAQWVAEHAPTGWFVALTGLAGRQPVLPRWWPRYGWFGRFDPDPAIVA